jgi:two-component system chemotaxis response regulator CheY
MRHQLRLFLQDRGFDVIEAESGHTALAQAQTHRFDLIISDVNMPGMNGIDFVKEVRRLQDHRSTPIFMLTTESTGDVVQRGKQAGATAWIVKPFKPDVLLKGIQKVTSP